MNLKIDHRLGVVDVKYFSNIHVSLKFDSLASTFSFGFLFDEKNKTHAELACVSHFHEAIVEHEGERLITGYILAEVFNAGSKTELTQFAGYSKAGTLEDCDIPSELFPLQSDGLSIAQIAQKIISSFKLKMIVDSSVASKMNAAIPTSTAKIGTNIKSYFTELCAQRRIIMSHDDHGNIIFTSANTEKEPIFHVEDGLIATTINMSFQGQGLHSHITVMKEADDAGGNAGEVTIENPYVPIIYRPKVMTVSSGDDISLQDAAVNALAAELKSIQLKITIDRWKIDGKLIRPNNVITVLSPKNFIYKKTKFFIESVDLEGDSTKQVASLVCVIPEVYNGKTPKNIFVDPHQNLPRI